MPQFQDYQQLLNNIEAPEIPAGLFDSVLQRLNNERKAAKVRKNLIIFSAVTVCSLVATIIMAMITQSNFSQSGFWQFFSLLFSDFGSMVNYWQNYVFSLLGAFPATNAILLLASLLVFVESFGLAVKNFKKYQFYIKLNLIHKI